MKRSFILFLVMALCGSVAYAGLSAEEESGTFAAKKDRFIRSAQALGQRVSKSAAAAWKVVRGKSDQLTEKFVGKMSKPLDRSGANKKAAMLSGALDEANRASAAATEKAKNANREIYRIKNEGFGSSSGSSSSSKSGSSSEGRFTSLD